MKNNKQILIAICLVLFVSTLIFNGCATTNDDIDKWGDSVNGEAKIAAAILDESNEQPVRVYGVLKLIKLQEFDVMIDSLKRLNPQSRAQIVGACAPEIGKLFKVPDMKIQAAAKDSLYMFMSFNQKVLQKSAKQAILYWYSTNFMKKYAAGKFSAFNVLTAIGKDSGDLIVDLLKKEGIKGQIKIAKIAEKINDPSIAQKASDYFLEQLKSQTPNLSPDLLQVLCYIRDHRVTDWLNQFVANKKNPMDVRINAFNTLTFHTSKISLPVATRIFIDRREHIDLRGIAIEIIEKVGDVSNLKYIYPFLKDEDVKWATFAAIIKLGGVAEIGNVFNKLPMNVKMWRGDYDVAARKMKKLSKDAAPELAKFLSSKKVPLVALSLLGLSYTADVQLANKSIKPMFDDSRVIENYISKKKYTVGQMAKSVYKSIGKRAKK